MKKIIFLICVFAFVVSLCAGVSAEDVVSFSIVSEKTIDESGKFTADIIAHLPEDVNVTQFGLLVDVPAGVMLESFDAVYTENGMYTCSETYFNSPYMIFWVSGTDSLPAGDTVLCTLSFKIIGDNTSDTEYVIGLEFDPEGKPADVDGNTVEAVVNGCTVIDIVDTVAVETTVTTTAKPVQSTVTTPRNTNGIYGTGGICGEITVVEVTDDNGNVVTDDEGNTVTTIVSDTIAVDADTVSVADTNTGAVQDSTSASTGDTAFIVVAAMVAALGCAVIVRKVNA